MAAPEAEEGAVRGLSIVESGTILLRETTKITSSGFDENNDVSVVDRACCSGR